MTIALLLWIACVIASSAIAHEKNRSWVDWMFFGIILGPIAILIVGLMPTWHPPKSTVKTKKCPYCAEFVKHEAIICKHCGKEFSDIQDKEGIQTTED